MRVIKDKEIDIYKWKELLDSSPYASSFQSPEFYNFFNTIPNQSAIVIAIEDDAKKLETLCVITIQKEKGIKGFFSRRAIIYGGPIIQEKDNLATDLLLKEIDVALKNKVIYIETRNLNNYKGSSELFFKFKWEYIPYLSFQFLFDNKSLDDFTKAMNYNRRREIKISIKEGAFFGEAQNEDEVKELFLMLRELYVNRVKLPLPDEEYFLKLFKSKIGKVFIVKHNEKIIGGTFCFYYPDSFIYTLYYCGIRDYHKKIFPTHLAIIAAIDFGIKNKLRGLDLMGAGKPSEDYGVRKYKAEFGGELIEYGRFFKITNPFLYKLGLIGLKIVKK